MSIQARTVLIDGQKYIPEPEVCVPPITATLSPGIVANLRTEADLATVSQNAISIANWTVGQCATLWMRRFSRERTDATFAEMVGLPTGQVHQRRRVWETFGDVCDRYPHLQWGHFFVALNWDDAADMLTWANEQQATLAEMMAYRRAIRGEDQTAEDEGPTPTEN